ncbi:class I SAM-dependent methyltransferase [Mesorhizobium sp.]|uniref:class I SAM-dependent methyltransferase n=1 Tax=Mesorhizobium sp. TaxID=1871066 RepID=UPI000FE3E932|nr:class I SAM-dependent methyltransferase [Mesorhizobium sp.]RWH70279.1 MAG: class I SAM-dependent methyltransferase [Mesorhizobium sp.]RWL23659.1 MAG: class I SAM-dependent methyltransferase [Mesorhizobium sp.]RWL25727.1 MAG: class I SAM-dependent methyltransferase [Mesorhizobium sp.]RWL34716.1 MAG: class I SAM-dependent methyltransferase [Mesorhizobium sp.]RWL42736.1 MAG: class I SAM-dependent methyltransferase [Mesorhizobium sp.]
MSKRATGNEFDAYRHSYSEAVNEAISFSGLDVDFFTRAKAVRLLDLLKSTLGPANNLSILDVGCGVGNYHPILRGKVGKLTGVDPSPECIDEAKQRNPGVFYRVSEGAQLPFDAGEFDAVFAICVMHHVPPADWAKFSSEMARVTRPGGAVLIFEHNPYNPLTRRIVSACPFDENAVLLSKRQVVHYLRGAGLSGVEGRYILTVPAIDGVLRRIDDAFGRIPLGAQYHVLGRR